MSAFTAFTFEQEVNPWEAQAARFDFAAEKLKLDPGIGKILRHSTSEVQNRQGYLRKELTVNEQLEQIISESFRDVIRYAQPMACTTALLPIWWPSTGWPPVSDCAASMPENNEDKAYA
jgi:hypothetical protein